MALSVIQTKVTNPEDGVDTSSASFASTPTSGNLIVVVIEGWDGVGFDVPAVGGVSDNQTNTYTRAVQSPDNNTATTSIFYSYSITSAGTFTVTITPTNTGNYLSWVMFEVAGATTTDPLDKVASNSATSNSLSSGTTASVAQNDEIVFSVCGFSNIITSLTVETVSPAWTEAMEQTDGENHEPGEINYRIITAGGAQSCSWVVVADSDSAYSASISTFKASAGGGGSAIKTWNGLADASTKTSNGLARASVKTRNGLA